MYCMKTYRVKQKKMQTQVFTKFRDVTRGATGDITLQKNDI